MKQNWFFFFDYSKKEKGKLAREKESVERKRWKLKNGIFLVLAWGYIHIVFP